MRASGLAKLDYFGSQEALESCYAAYARPNGELRSDQGS